MTLINKLTLTLALPVLLLPLSVSAGDTANFDYFDEGANQFRDIVNTLIPILFALALLLFVWGVINYFILGAGDEGKRETGRSYMLYAIIGLVAITAVWGIVGLLSQILGVDGVTIAPDVPDVPSETIFTP